MDSSPISIDGGHYYDVRNSQPGLEPVAHHAQPGKQVFTPATDPRSFKESFAPESATSPNSSSNQQFSTYQAGGFDDGKILVSGPAATARRRQQKWWMVGAAVLIAVIAGLIGGIVGWKVTENKNHSSAAATSNGTSPGASSDSDSIAGASRMIQPNSALAVTGWRFGTDFAIRLFYQGPDDLIRFSSYDTVFANWSAPRVLDVDAASGTPLSVSIIWWLPDVEDLNPYPQMQLFFRDTAGKIDGQNWRDGGPVTGFSDSIVNASFTPAADSRLATYWPSTVYQDSDGSVQEIYFNLTNGGYQKPASLAVSGTAAGPLIALPLTPAHGGKELRVLYRRSDGKLYEFNRNAAGTTVSSSGAMPFSVPDGAGVGAFATANSGDDSLTTYLVWQDTAGNGTVQIAWQDGSADGWKGPVTDPVFDGADNPTQLACVTAGSTGGDATVPLQAKDDMNRCYFQVGGALKEVLYDGSEWTDLGFVKMP